MKQDELDRALSAEIVPSAGFASGVMEAVRREASEPPPIPFPWSRALPALLAVVAAIVIELAKGPDQAPSAVAHSSGLLPGISHALLWADPYGIGWIALAILVTAACFSLSMRLATGSWRTL